MAAATKSKHFARAAPLFTLAVVELDAGVGLDADVGLGYMWRRVRDGCGGWQREEKNPSYLQQRSGRCCQSRKRGGDGSARRWPGRWERRWERW